MLFIDQPVGTGFSYTDRDGYQKSVRDSTQHLFTALQQFLKMFPALQSSDLYVTGESYAGKYIPWLGYVIYQENESYRHEFPINLKGLAIGNGYTDPINMLHYSQFAKQLGLVDEHGYNLMRVYEFLGREFIDDPESKIVSIAAF